MGQELQAMIDCQELTLYDSDRIPYEPTEKDVVGRLEKITHEFSTHYDNNFNGKAKYSACKGYRCFNSDTLLKALLKLFMWVKFGKEWKEDKWLNS